MNLFSPNKELQTNKNSSVKTNQNLSTSTALAVAADVTGDFRSTASGDWTNIGSWERWDGTDWVAATEFPGQNSGTYTVTIQAGHTITLLSNIATSNMGILTIQGDLILDISGNGNPDIIDLNSSNIDISSTGTLNFVGTRVRLNLPASTAIAIDSGGSIVASTCNNNNEIYIGTRRYASCAGGGATVYTFGEVTLSGGVLNAEITDPATATITNSCESISFTGGYEGTESDSVTYSWDIINPDGSITPISTGSLSGNITDDGITTPPSSFTPTSVGVYLLSFTVSSSTFTNVETVTINVTDDIDPVLTKEADQNVALGAACTVTIPNVVDGSSATDNCA
ncbi:hypothetical protein, partial [Confluentibacter citreus]|uniref:hypothetical protein n=1 Tax=Confluentibacter citreus TaxID=2007307 RepID=UPI00195688CD